jgi:hypothetical protein
MWVFVNPSAECGLKKLGVVDFGVELHYPVDVLKKPTKLSTNEGVSSSFEKGGIRFLYFSGKGREQKRSRREDGISNDSREKGGGQKEGTSLGHWY